MTSNTSAGPRIIGTLRTEDGISVVRMEDRFDTDIDDLWSAFTDPSRLARWIGEIDGDLRLGGEFRARWFASGWEGTGTVDVCEPPRHFRLTTYDANPQPGQPPETFIEVQLAADGNQTLLVVEERGMPVSMIAGYGAGVQMHVEHLADHVAGREHIDVESRWEELFPVYRGIAAGIR
jgi:uncharacterized protein YndB with AHSA1/START domain